jgi:GLPGLI family protein
MNMLTGLLISGTRIVARDFIIFMQTRQMKQFNAFGLGICLLAGSTGAMAQRSIAEGTIVYDIVIQTGSTSLQGASNTIYLKGNNSRTDMVSPLGNETTIHNAKSGAAVILKEYSGQKLMIKLTKDNWDSKNKAYQDINFETSGETKTIAGYTCKKAIAKMADGKTFTVYYSPDLVAANKEYDPTFSNLKGLAMEYEIETGKMKFKYSLSKVNFDAVQIARFDFPTSGYRVMSYEESQQMKKGK